MVRATSVYSAGEPYTAAFYCRGKNPATLGYVSVLEFVAIESYLKKAISSDYPSKSIELQKKRSVADPVGFDEVRSNPPF